MSSESAIWARARPHVHSIALELTGFCNQKCDYCYNAFRDDGGASVGTADTAKLLARMDRILDAVDLEHVTLTGGEPLASHDLFEVLDGLRARNVRVQMISNASLVTDAIAERLARYRLMSVLVTLNGPSALMHDTVIDAPGNFDKTLEGIRRLRRKRVPVQGSIVLTRKNASFAGEILQLFHSLDVRSVALSRFSPAGYSVAFAEALMPSREDVTLALEQAVTVIRERTIGVFSTMPIPPCAVETKRFQEIQFNQCPIGTERQEFALSTRGELRHCALHRDAIVPGRDVLDPDVDLAQLFRSGDPHRYRAVSPSYCRECEHLTTCGGGCGAAAQWVAGDHREVDPFVNWAEKPGISRRSLPIIG